MAFCQYCGAQLKEGAAFCENCGGSIQQASSAPAYTPPQPENGFRQTDSYQQPDYSQQPGNSQQGSGYRQPYAQSSAYQQVPNYAAGGLIAWSIVSIFLCTIPGVVALVNALGINKAATVEEQQKKISRTKTWCIVGTVLGVLAIIGSLAANS